LYLAPELSGSYGHRIFNTIRLMRLTYCPKQSLHLLGIACITLAVSAREVPFETRGFVPVTGGERILPDYHLFVASFDELAFAGNNASDLVIVRDIARFFVDDAGTEEDDSDDSNVYIAAYQGFNSVTGVNQDSGVLMIQNPLEDNLLAQGGAVGFIRKTGPWAVGTETVDTTIGNASGTISYTNLLSVRPVTMKLTGRISGSPYTISGDTNLQVLTTDSVQLQAWEASSGQSPAFAFGSMILTREGTRYRGLLRRTDEEEPLGWKTRYAYMQVVDDNDVDGDGTPDLSDSGGETITRVIAIQGTSLGAGQYWSSVLETLVYEDPSEMWMYGERIGWFYLSVEDGDAGSARIFIADPNLGWLRTDKQIRPDFVRESDGATIVFSSIDGKAFYKDPVSGTWRQPIYSE
jgi:hypothetical protein